MNVKPGSDEDPRGTAEVRCVAASTPERLTVIEISEDGMWLERIGEPIPTGTAILVEPTFWPRSEPSLHGTILATTMILPSVSRMRMRFDPLTEDARRLLMAHGGSQRGKFCSFEELRSTSADPVRFSTIYPHAFLVPMRRDNESLEIADLVALRADVYPVRSAQGASSPVRLGRVEDNDIVIDHQCISRHHAAFERHPITGAYWITDCGSRNGTRIDGLRVQAMQRLSIESRSALDVGGLVFRFVSSSDMAHALQTLQTLQTSRPFDRDGSCHTLVVPKR
jgi:hypothetical protein